jgi:uncharacterized protein involved in type VI secretion and phage assembly
MADERFYGKYRGEVTNNKDPDGLGRVKAVVPEVFGINKSEDSSWALPCLPFAGDQLGLFVVPPVGASVWIEFEYGDPKLPIWSGCFWKNKSALPKLPSGAQNQPDAAVLICTKGGHRITLDDSASGGIMLEASGGQKLTISSQGIEIDNGNGANVKLSNNQVSINDGALEVT